MVVSSRIGQAVAGCITTSRATAGGGGAASLDDTRRLYQRSTTSPLLSPGSARREPVLSLVPCEHPFSLPTALCV